MIKAKTNTVQGAACTDTRREAGECPMCRHLWWVIKNARATQMWTQVRGYCIHHVCIILAQHVSNARMPPESHGCLVTSGPFLVFVQLHGKDVEIVHRKPLTPNNAHPLTTTSFSLELGSANSGMCDWLLCYVGSEESHLWGDAKEELNLRNLSDTTHTLCSHTWTLNTLSSGCILSCDLAVTLPQSNE